VQVDTSSHYLAVAKLKKIIHGMSLNKLNVLHWHFSDATAITIPSKQFDQNNLTEVV